MSCEGTLYDAMLVLYGQVRCGVEGLVGVCSHTWRKQKQLESGADSFLRRKLVIIGDGACGKTSLLSVFTLGYFPTVSGSTLLQ